MLYFCFVLINRIKWSRIREIRMSTQTNRPRLHFCIRGARCTQYHYVTHFFTIFKLDAHYILPRGFTLHSLDRVKCTAHWVEWTQSSMRRWSKILAVGRSQRLFISQYTQFTIECTIWPMHWAEPSILNACNPLVFTDFILINAYTLFINSV